jgi:hypothetical protein
MNIDLKFIKVKEDACWPAAGACDHIEHFGRAMTATELAAILCVSRIIIHKLAKKNRIPSLGLGCGRFDPKAIAAWLRAQ